MAYLLDTDVISATRKSPLDETLERWFRRLRPGEVFISALSIGEIQRGIEKQYRINADFAQDLTTWLDKMLQNYMDRILPVDAAIARQWGILSQRVGNSNIDVLIAATAIEHGLTVATRNIRHFEPTGADVINPFL